MALPKEPRQKMINLMYLVLTCLLALNVSSEILNAFKTIDRSLTSTNATVNASTQNILQSLSTLASKPETAEKGQLWLGKAQNVTNISKTLYDYLTELKNKIIKEANGDPNDPSKPFKEDNLDIVTKIMVKEGEGKKLYSLLDKYKKEVLNVDPAIKTEFEKSLQIDLSTPPSKEGTKKDWEVAYFHMIPTVAGLTILSKFQNDVKNSENKIVNFCHNQVGKVEVVFDSYAAVVGQSSNYLMPGQELEITAGVGAFSKKAQPTIVIGGSNIGIGEDGTAKYKIPSGGIGQHTIPVRITFFNQNTNKQETIEKTVSYTVGQASASIALDKMNVLYIGIDNPVTISASGGGSDRLTATISGGRGSLTKGAGGKFTARVGEYSDNCIISVFVDGKQVGASSFRVRAIPQANAFVGGQPSGANITAGAFKAQGGVQAGIKDFPFDLVYNVIEYTFTVDTDEGDVIPVRVRGSNAFTPEVRNAINRHVKAGKLVTIDDIKIKGPDGNVRTPAAGGTIIYYIK